LKKSIICTAIFMASSIVTMASGSRDDRKGFLYQAKFVQAAPGRLLDLIEIYKAQAVELKRAGEEAPLWMRHSQGDKWDLMLLFPIGSYHTYYSADRIERRLRVSEQFEPRFRDVISWQEDLFVNGPPVEDLRAAFDKASFFHVEIFQSLAGKQAELYRQREMENRYSRALRRPENFIFVRDQGASWDLFTVGCYHNLKHYAESSDIPEKDQESAARAAGFEGAATIGPYLRSLISQHHDTLAVAVK
jgi:hypothetical protein